MSIRTINNRYAVIRSLGRGVTGEVFLVRDSSKGREVALKVLDGMDPGRIIADSIRHEFTLLSRLSHPNLVEVYDFGFIEGTEVPFFTEEYIDGPDFFHAFDRMDGRAFIEAVVQVLRGLEYIHSRGFIHRDLKPQNILVGLGSGGVSAKILDLSLAGPQGAEDGGKVRGTVLYLAPEVIRGGEVDRRTDLYSLGVTIHHVLERKPPFSGSSVREVIRQQLEKELPPVSDTRFGFFTGILSRMTAKNPEMRFPSADAVIEAVNDEAGTSFARETGETRLSYARSIPVMSRSGPLKELTEWLDRPSDGRPVPAVYFLEGARGTGKTALLKEFRRAVQMSNVRFMEGNPPKPLETPYWGFQNVLEEMVNLIGRDSDLFGTYESSISRLNPRLSGSRPAPSWQGPMEEGQKLRLHSEISRFIMKAAGRAPICLCFDDFEKADRGTFELVGAIIRSMDEAQRSPVSAGNGRPAPLSMILSYNPDNVSKKRYALIRAKFPEPLCRRVVLSNLDEEGTRAALREMLGDADVPEGFWKRMHELSGGNPGLIASAIESLMESGGLVRREGRWSVTEEAAKTFSPPPDLAGAILARFNSLGPDARVGLRVLGLSACAVPGPLLASAVERCGRDAFEAIHALLAEGLVTRKLQGGEVRYSLAEPAFAEIASRISEGPAEAEMHRIIGEESEKYHPAPSYEVSAALAEHFKRAGDIDKALAHLFNAAEGFAQLGAFKTALKEYSTGLDLVRAGGVAMRGKAAEILFRRAHVYRVLGRFQDALEDLEDALKTAEEDKSQPKVARALALLAELNLQWGKYFMTEVLATRARDLAQMGEDRENLLLAETLLGMLAFRRGEYVAAEQKLAAAEALSRELGKPGETARILMEIAGAQQRLGRLHEALSNLRSALSQYKSLSDAQGIASCLASIGNTHFLMGEYDDALSHYRKALRINGESGDVNGMISVNYSIGNILLQIGLYPSARKYFEASISLSRTFDLPGQTAQNKSGLAFLDLVEGRLGSALRQFGESLEQYQAIGARSGALWAGDGIGVAYTRLNQFERARETFYEIARDVEETGEIRVYADVLINLAELELRAGEMEKAEDFARRSLAQARKGSLKDFETSFHQVMGEIALAGNDLDGAEAEFASALEAARSMRIESSAAEAEVSLAKVLLAKGRPEDALESAEKGLAQARRENCSLVIQRGAAAAGEALTGLGDFGRAAHFMRIALEQVAATLDDLDAEYHERYLVDKRRLFERSRWLIEKLTQGRARS